MGRSHADFAIPGGQAGMFLGAAAAFGAANQYSRAPAPPNQVALVGRKSLMQGTRWIVVTAWDVPGGAQLAFDAWIDAGSLGMHVEYSADPSSIVAGVPRRAFWKVLSTMLLSMGLPPDQGHFRHQ